MKRNLEFEKAATKLWGPPSVINFDEPTDPVSLAKKSARQFVRDNPLATPADIFQHLRAKIVAIGGADDHANFLQHVQFMEREFNEWLESGADYTEVRQHAVNYIFAI